jgi:hypothetical protein
MSKHPKISASEPSAQNIAEANVLYVGAARARALADAGIVTLDDLRAADAAQIGRVKGVGLLNGERIKAWLAEQDAVQPITTTAIDNQALQDDMSAIDNAITRIQQALPEKIAHKKLDRQVDKLLNVVSELAEGPDTLRPKQMRRTLKMLHVITALLEKFASVSPLSDKIVAAFAEELRDHRRRLQDILDPKK